MPIKQKIIDQARQLLRHKKQAVLSTHSKTMSGFPFGSVTTYCLLYTSDAADE